MAALAKAKRDGLARHIGVANFNIALLDQAIALCPEPLVALQAEGHPYIDTDKLLEAVRARGVVFTAYCPLGRGRLFSDPVLAEIAKASAARSHRSRCAGWCSAATSSRSRARPIRGGSQKFRRVRFHAQRRRDGAHRDAQAGGWTDRQSGGTGASVGLNWLCWLSLQESRLNLRQANEIIEPIQVARRYSH